MKNLNLLFGAALLAGVAALSLPAAGQNLAITGNLTVGGQIATTGVAPALRNLLDNGAMLIQQRGTAVVTAGTTSGCAITSYSADRWCADVNVTSGAGQLTPITAAPAPPTGFQQSMKLVRNSGALTQPQCAWQEIPTSRVVPVAGNNVMVSAFLQALAGLSADNSNVATLVIITGTGTDQGMGVLRGAVGMTASPAITPAWTGIATLQTTNFTLSAAAWTRFNGAAILLPATVTEMAVGVCFTPTATGAGATDGFAFTGVQLEVVPAGATAPTAYEFRPLVTDLQLSQRFFTALPEPAAGVAVPVVGTAISTTVSTSSYPFPVTMDVAPTFQNYGNALSATTWTLSNAAVNNVLATTFIVTKTANTPQGASMTITSSGMTAGSGTILLGAAGGDILGWSADF